MPQYSNPRSLLQPVTVAWAGDGSRELRRVCRLECRLSQQCELGCWALDAAKISFDEHAFAPGQNVLPALSLRVAGKERHLSRTSAVTAVAKSDGDDSSSTQKPYKPHHATAVPACVLPDGRVLVDSWSIVQHSAATTGQPPPSVELQACLDQEVGPLVSRTGEQTLKCFQ